MCSAAFPNVRVHGSRRPDIVSVTKQKRTARSDWRTGSVAMNERMTLEAFGAQLLDTEDLDPIYVVLVRANLERNHLRRWLLAYWCFYHAGVASYLSEMPFAWKYWSELLEAASNGGGSCPVPGRWPRGRERRHFRGNRAEEAVGWLYERFHIPEDAVRSLEDISSGPYANVAREVQTWPQFGPWMAFKIADMLERVLGCNIDFRGHDVLFFKSPREAAQLWHRETNSNQVNPTIAACYHLQQTLGNYLAPPTYDRPVSLQEFETILCKWKSHRNGHYPVGNDIHELHTALDAWKNVSVTAKKLLMIPLGVRSER